jgi:hypothetical protein
MPDFISHLFFVVGFVATFFGAGAAIIWFFERSSNAKRERDERHRELVRKLGDIEFHLKLKKDA